MIPLKKERVSRGSEIKKDRIKYYRPQNQYHPKLWQGYSFSIKTGIGYIHVD